MKYKYYLILGAFSLACFMFGCKGSSNSRRTITAYPDFKISHFRTIPDHTGDVFSVCFNSNDDILVSGGKDCTVRCWDIDKNVKMVLVGHSMQVNSVDFSTDGQFVISGSSVEPDTGEIILWNMMTGSKIWSIKEPLTGQVYSIKFNSDGSRFAYGSQNYIKIREFMTGELIWVRKTNPAVYRSISFSPDGKLLASASLDQIIRLWDTSSGKLVESIKAHLQGVATVAFSPDGKILASAGFGEIKLWDAFTRKEIQTFSGHNDWVHSLAFSPDGALLASGCEKCGVKLWDVYAKKEITTVPDSDTQLTYSISFNYDGSLFAASGEKVINIYELTKTANVKH